MTLALGPGTATVSLLQIVVIQLHDQVPDRPRRLRSETGKVPSKGLEPKLFARLKRSLSESTSACDLGSNKAGAPHYSTSLFMDSALYDQEDISPIFSSRLTQLYASRSKKLLRLRRRFHQTQPTINPPESSDIYVVEQ